MVVDSAQASTRRVVVLGASNVARGCDIISQVAERTWGEPLDLLVAAGHGRSYGVRSSFMGRTLPGILNCGLWDELSRRPSLPTAAIVTDVGNDLVYGSTPEQIIRWVRTCCERIQERSEKLLITSLPLSTIQMTGSIRFWLLSHVFFPFSQLRLVDVIDGTKELDTRLRELAQSLNATIVDLDPKWYGLDPIHIRTKWTGSAWSQICAPWNVACDPPRRSLRRWLRLQTVQPQEQTWLGMRWQDKQPCCTLPCGTVVSFF